MPAGDDKQRIRERAYELWEREGCPQGRHVDHWVQAERETQTGSAGLDRPGEGDAGLFGETGRMRAVAHAEPSGGPERGFGASGGLGSTDTLAGVKGKGGSARAAQAPGERSAGAMGATGQPTRAAEPGQGAAEKSARARGKNQEDMGEPTTRRGSRRKE